MNLLFAMDDVSDKLSGEEARRVADASLDALRLALLFCFRLFF